ncbi:MAG: hypothetical protein IVW54_02840 [Candidatus Binataceae bacterium]|nr:hypothetical protein [Candidatus Binataceae bacterium]
MELRYLTTDRQREIFGERLAHARANVGLKFKEKSRSQLARIQLMFGNLYALYEDEQDSDESMISGVAMHDLEMFPQTCPKPDLTHLRPSSVIEMSDFWSLSKGAGMLVWCGAAVQVAHQNPGAILVYMVVGPGKRLASYLAAGFAKVGESFVYPYLETAEGGEVKVQTLILEGARLAKLIRVLSRMTAGRLNERGSVRLRDFVGLNLDRSSGEDLAHPRQPRSGGYVMPEESMVVN